MGCADSSCRSLLRVSKKSRKRTSRRTQALPLSTSNWKPRLHPSETLDRAFFRRCHQIEREIISRVAYEKEFNEQNFDSGWAVEEIMRQVLRELLPRRYAVQAASISDSKGYSAGDCDVAIFNDFWFPVVKSGPTADSRKVYLPIEGVYAVLEIKQTLTPSSLKSAMQKLVTCHRLFRPPSSCDRLVENHQRSACTHYVSNPLFSAVVATDLAGWTRDEAVASFIRINQLLPRTDVVHSLCILGQGVITWAYRPDPSGDQEGFENLASATFMREDRFSELIPLYGRTDVDDSPLYEFMARLMGHLLSSVLAPENIAIHYGHGTAMSLPKTPGATLMPDPNLLRSLEQSCIGQDRSTDSAYHQRS
ncbi:DUF6602 domain-containing protein [Nonomuraea helvata]|uniref:DUF6602 domain-containing protein n=1 Tax=Nonomuraea helvata TaxID=37484 RepID=A0ABV5SB88_9ACTN